MKKILLMAVAAMMATGVFAQETVKKLYLYKGNTVVVAQNYDDIDSIVFVDLIIPETPTNSNFQRKAFTVNAQGKQVYFSQGNLQFLASTNTWRFAENQYDVIGEDNSAISSMNEDWIDLFGWGTSGYNNMANDPFAINYQPWATSSGQLNQQCTIGDVTYNSDDVNFFCYGPSTFMTDSNLIATSANYDWGVYNAISNGGKEVGQWRTLTDDEWYYIFYSRDMAQSLRSQATICGMQGYVLLPDDFTLPEGLSWSNQTNDWEINTYDSQAWSAMEAAGAVFLPAAGVRRGTEVRNVGSWGYYWSVSYDTPSRAKYMYFRSDNAGGGKVGRFYGLSVRLVQDAEPEIPEQPETPTNPNFQAKAFTVNAKGKQVSFSQGNLQYQASTDTWRFAENQYDMVGSGNQYISSTNEGWIDLFGWGTSGYNNTANDPFAFNYQPWATSREQLNQQCTIGGVTYNSDEVNYYGYGPSTFMIDKNLTGTSANYDWGVYNAIANGGNEAGQWRTLTDDEWDYIFNSRNKAQSLRSQATVCGEHGYILLPDDFTLPEGLSWSNQTNDWEINTYDSQAWSAMEAAGAVFLPAAGYRNGTVVSEVGSLSYYWSASYSDKRHAWGMGFISGGTNMYYDGRSIGFSVRLIQDIEPEEPEQPETPVIPNFHAKTFTVNGEGKQIYFSQGNLQYQASTNTWRFAENQYDMIGRNNRKISSIDEGWIDLFGWGTSGYNNTANDPFAVNYHPWSASNDQLNQQCTIGGVTYNSDEVNYYGYGPSTFMTDKNLTGTSANYDWGVYNAIANGGNEAGLWRTLTIDEWRYIFYNRPLAQYLRSIATVCGVHGYILLPDDFTKPDGLNWNHQANDWDTNTYDSQAWSAMEATGAVFLPAAGYRYSTNVMNGVDSDGYYWSASSDDQGYAGGVFFNLEIENNSGISDTGSTNRCCGLSVRLVQDAE